MNGTPAAAHHILTERLVAVRDELKIAGSCSMELASTPGRDEVEIRLRGPAAKLLRLEYRICQ